jgi:integrase
MSGRKRKKGNVYKRAGTRFLWVWYYDPEGKRVAEVARDKADPPQPTSDERAARAWLTRRTDEVAAGTWTPWGRDGAKPPEVLTVRTYLEGWIEARRKAGVRNARTEELFLTSYVIPAIGDLALGEVKRTHVKDMVAGLTRTRSERTGEILSARTVLHVYRTLVTAFKDAVDDEKITASPCTLRTRKGELPKKRDKDPKWRTSAVYTREEITALLSDPRVEIDRRALYALQALAGLRGSEATGRRWQDYDASAVPLGRLTVATQADGTDDETETKTGEIREVPVHPTLASILEEWRRAFPVYFGRAPRPEDPIVPSRASRAGRLSFRSASGVFERLASDLEALGLRRVPSLRHAMRATFLSLLEVDGANMGIARRATHAAPADVVGGYIRVQWADLCREVARLQVSIAARYSPRDSDSPEPSFLLGVAGFESPPESGSRAHSSTSTLTGTLDTPAPIPSENAGAGQSVTHCNACHERARRRRVCAFAARWSPYMRRAAGAFVRVA